MPLPPDHLWVLLCKSGARSLHNWAALVRVWSRPPLTPGLLHKAVGQVIQSTYSHLLAATKNSVLSSSSRRLPGGLWILGVICPNSLIAEGRGTSVSFSIFWLLPGWLQREYHLYFVCINQVANTHIFKFTPPTIFSNVSMYQHRTLQRRLGDLGVVQLCHGSSCLGMLCPTSSLPFY